jgi:hypothetical protein
VDQEGLDLPPATSWEPPLNPSLKNLEEEEVKEELELRKKKEPLLYSIPSFATANQPVRLAGG